MSVLSRTTLESSPLADLHEIASELGVDGFRRLRKADLVATILARQSGEEGVTDEDAPVDEEAVPAAAAEVAAGAASDGDGDGAAAAVAAEEEDEADAPKRRSRRGGRTRTRTRTKASDADADADTDDAAGATRPAAAEDVAPEATAAETEADPAPARAGRRRSEPDAEPVAEGVVELIDNGSGFVRVEGDGAEDVYISAAQVRRCELVSGDRVTGPVRPPRRSERHPSLVRVDTINGRAADEVAEGTHFDDLPAAFPTQRFALPADDPTLKAIEWLTPLGRGSRVSVVGPARAGKTEALRRLAVSLAAQEGLELSVALAGARPEEIGEWRAAGLEPAAVAPLGASADAQGQAVDRVLDVGRRIAARGGHAVVVIDALDDLPAHAGRRALAAARSIVDGGSLTVIAAATLPLGGETTVIALDAALTSTARFPALDLVASGTLRPELLVGEAGADAIAQARAAAMG